MKRLCWLQRHVFAIAEAVAVRPGLDGRIAVLPIPEVGQLFGGAEHLDDAPAMLTFGGFSGMRRAVDRGVGAHHWPRNAAFARCASDCFCSH